MPDQTISLTIGALSKTCRVPAPTIRYYEKIELLPQAERNRSDQRRYGCEAVQQLTFIRRCRDFGFSIKQIRTLMAVPSGSTAHCQPSRDIAQSHIKDVRTKIADLLALEQTLKGLITSCQENCGERADQTCTAFVEMKLPT